MASTARTLLKPLAHRFIHWANRGYITGESLQAALAIRQHLAGFGHATAPGYWNQKQEAPADVINAYLKTLASLSASPHKDYLSIKAPAFHFDRAHYQQLLQRARALRVPLHFDSLSHEQADATFALILENTPEPLHDMGCTLPGRWRRSVADAADLATRGINLRVVKGQWADPTDPDTDPAAGFLDVIEQLGGARNVRIASHDPSVVIPALEYLRGQGTPCELEVLYGLPVAHLLPIARDYGVTMRVYIPYGKAWLPYGLRAVKHNPKILWALFKDALSGPYLEKFRPPST